MTKKNYYYIVNYFYGSKDSGSFFLKTDKNLREDDDAIIEEAIKLKVINESDADCIVSTGELSEEEYYEWNRI